MGAALEGGYDLAALSLLFVALALLIAVKGLAQALHDALNVSILGAHPFGGIASGLERTLISWIDDAIKGVERVAARFLSGLIDSWGMLIAIPALLAVGTKAAFQYLWNTALPALLSSTIGPVRTLARQALDRVEALQATVAANVGKAERYALGRAEAALADAQAYADARIKAAEHALHLDIAAGVAEAEAFASTAVGKLRAAEDGAIAGAIELASAAKAAGIAAAAAAIAEAERVSGINLSAAEARAAAALAEAQAAGQAALGAVKSIAVTAEDELATIEGGMGAIGVAGLIAAIPAIGSLVHAIATESGLENAECRSKVKGICGTDPSAWAGLLEGLLALGFAFSLRELVEVANPLVGELAGIIDQAA